MFAFLRSEKLGRASSLIGAIIYGMNIWVAVLSARFSFMVPAAFWLPLIAWAFRHYQLSGRWGPLSLAIGCAVANNFYFGFQICLFLGTLFLCFSLGRGVSLHDYLIRIAKLAGITGVGLLLSAVSFFVAVGALFEADRSPASVTFSVLPSWDTISHFPELLLAGNRNYSLFVLPAFCILFLSLRPRQFKSDDLKRTLLTLFWVAAFFVPLTSSIMNGMSAETTRWHFIVLFMFAWSIPHWLSSYIASHRTSWVLLVTSILMTAIATGQHLTDYPSTEKWAYLLFIAQSASCAVLFGLARHPLMKSQENGCRHSMFLKYVLLCLIATGFFSLSYECLTQVCTREDADTTQRMVFPESSVIEDVDIAGNQFTQMDRIDNMGTPMSGTRTENASWVSGWHTVSVYNSLVDGNLHRWFKRLYNISGHTVSPSYYQGFDNRYFLEIAWGLKYKAGMKQQRQSEDDTPPQPYGQYVNKESEGSDYRYLENTLSTGFDLWYDSVLPEDTFDAMDYAERDAALLQAVVVPDAIAAHYPQSELDDVTDIQMLDLSDATLDNCSEVKSGLLSMKQDASIVFPLEDRGDAKEGEWLFSLDIASVDDEPFTLTVNSKSQLKMPSTYAWNYPLTEYSFGIRGSARELRIELTPGLYRLSDLRIAYNSYAQVEKWVRDRNKCNLQNLYINGGHISGTIDCPAAGILVLSMPYAAGWSCTVDGKPTPLFIANGAFVGLSLPAGFHTISLTYRSPHVAVGATTTILTAIGLGLYLLSHSCLKRRNDREKSREHKSARTVLSRNMQSMFWYVFAGASAAIIEVAIFAFLHFFIELPIEASNIVAILTATGYNFLFNRNVSFKSSSSVTAGLVKYILLFLANMAFSTSILSLAAQHDIPIMPIKLMSMICIMLWNYVLYRKVVFR